MPKSITLTFMLFFITHSTTYGMDKESEGNFHQYADETCSLLNALWWNSMALLQRKDTNFTKDESIELFKNLLTYSQIKARIDESPSNTFNVLTFIKQFEPYIEFLADHPECDQTSKFPKEFVDTKISLFRQLFSLNSHIS